MRFSKPPMGMDVAAGSSGFFRPRGVPRVIYIPRPRGMGDYQSEVNTGAQIAKAGVDTTIGILVQIGSIGGPVGALIGAAAAGLIAVGSAIAKAFEGCGETCVIASDLANKVGDYLQQNVDAYVSAPYNPALQAAALNNFDSAWAALVQACGNPNLQAAGQRCISDRQSGACKWQSSPGGWVSDGQGGYTYTKPGPAGSGTACWNYFVGFRDPIANDPRGAAAISQGGITGLLALNAQAGQTVLNALGVSPSVSLGGLPIADLVLPAGLFALGVLL